MPIQTSSSPSILPATQTSMAAPLKEFANQMIRAAASNKDPATAGAFSALGEALALINRNFDLLTGSLRSPLPQADPIQVVDSNGVLIASIGDILDTGANKAFEGIWANQLYAAGDGPSTALFTVQGNSVRIEDALFISSVSGITTTVGNETIGSIGVVGIEIQDNTTLDALIETPTFLAIYRTDPSNNLPTIAIAKNANAGILKVFDGSGSGGISGEGDQIICDGSNGNIQALGTVTSTGGFVRGSLVGISTTRNMVTAVTMSGAAVFGTPAAGQSNGTVVTGVTLTTSTFSGGIITS